MSLHHIMKRHRGVRSKGSTLCIEFCSCKITYSIACVFVLSHLLRSQSLCVWLVRVGFPSEEARYHIVCVHQRRRNLRDPAFGKKKTLLSSVIE